MTCWPRTHAVSYIFQTLYPLHHEDRHKCIYIYSNRSSTIEYWIEKTEGVRYISLALLKHIKSLTPRRRGFSCDILNRLVLVQLYHHRRKRFILVSFNSFFDFGRQDGLPQTEVLSGISQTQKMSPVTLELINTIQVSTVRDKYLQDQ